LGDHAQAILWWRKAGAGLRFYEYGYSLEQSGDLADAETVYLTATEIDPSLAAAYIGLARISEIQRRWDDAVRYYREAIRLHPQQGSLYYSLGNILVQELQEPAKAISVFEEGVDSDATYLWNYIGLERGYRSINDFENALYWLNRAALTSPDSAFPQIDYGYFYLNLGDWNKALVYFRQAIKIDPSQRGSYYQIARILRQHGELEAAIDFYLSAIRISPDFVPALMELADTYLEMGRTADACEYYGFVIGLAPSNSSARSQYRSRGCGK
jgi:superkiller protein 3